MERWLLKRMVVDRSTTEVQAPEMDHLVLALDAATFGVGRARILRSIAEGDPHVALTARDSRELSGFILGRQGAVSDHIGPCVARIATARTG